MMKDKRDKRENAENLQMERVAWYREKIVGMIGRIEGQRFLKAIYISISEYLQENEPD